MDTNLKWFNFLSVLISLICKEVPKENLLDHRDFKPSRTIKEIAEIKALGKRTLAIYYW